MIRTAIFIAATTLCFGVAAAQSNPNGQATTQNSASQNGQTSNAIPTGAPIEASLSKSIDAKKAKQGETIEARVTENTEQNGNVLIPRGAKLEGRVTQVSARSNGDSSSSVEITFDKAILKKGEEIPLNVGVQAIAVPQSVATAPASSNTEPMNSGVPTSGVGRPGGGAPGGTSPVPDSTPSGVQSPAPNQISSSPGAVGGLNSNGQLAPNSSGVFGLPGISLSAGTAASQPSAIITSNGKDLHLESGTQLLLVTRPAATPAAAVR
jgi:hypothetical protein